MLREGPKKCLFQVLISIFDFWNHFNAIGKFALICLLLLVGYGLIGGNMDYFFKPNVARKNLKSLIKICPYPFLSITLIKHPTSSLETSL
jgi:hypothetical protein